MCATITNCSRTVIIFVSFFLLAGTTYGQKNNAFPLTTAIWKTNTISVCWDNMDPKFATERQWVREAVKNTWEKYSLVRFTEWVSATELDADLHIFVNDENPHTETLGRKLKNMKKGMVLNFSFERWSHDCKDQNRQFCIKAIAVHEFGHALGFAHEQNKPDCKFDNCLKEPQGDYGDWTMDQCDAESIMNYCNKDWNNNGFLSQLDIKALQYFYKGSDNESSLFQGYQLVHNSAVIDAKNIGTKKINHYIRVYLIADSLKLQQVKKVIYLLHDETFKNPVITIEAESAEKNNNPNFGLGLRVWGEFEIIAIIVTKDDNIYALKRELTFDDGLGNPKRKGR